MTHRRNCENETRNNLGYNAWIAFDTISNH